MARFFNSGRHRPLVLLLFAHGTKRQLFLGNTFPSFFFFTLGDLVFYYAGNLYGTALQGGASGIDGGVYQLTPSGGGWVETNILTLGNEGTGGADPFAGVILDNAGNLYGATAGTFGVGHYPYGTVYELSPSGSGLVYVLALSV